MNVSLERSGYARLFHASVDAVRVETVSVNASMSLRQGIAAVRVVRHGHAM